MTSKMDERMYIRIPTALFEALKEKQRQTGIKRQELIRSALHQFLYGPNGKPTKKDD